jgi:hypothetical protein
MVKPVKARRMIQEVSPMSSPVSSALMAGLAHQAGREEAAGDEAARPGRAHQAERDGRKSFGLAAQRQQQPV